MRRPLSELILNPSEATAAGITAAALEAIAEGRLQESDPLPSTRQLAAQVGCSRTVTVRAYDELVAAGYVVAVPGSGTRVAPGARQAAQARLATRVPPSPPSPASKTDTGAAEHALSLRAGIPDACLINPADWRRAWRFAAARPVEDTASREHPSALLETAIIDHVRRHRGIVAEPVQFASGASSAITALVAASGLPGVMEDPGYRRAREAFQIAGIDPGACPVDDQGLMVDHLGDTSQIVYLTPAHQFPLGMRMSLPRRQQALEWAHDTGSVLVEDDYDGEFRYGVAPLPALRSLPGAQDVVAYIGTASKMLTPSLHAAWIIAPPALQPALREQLLLRRSGIATMTATALAQFISSGALDRHIARAGRTYSARRSSVIRALHDEIPDLHIGGVSAGIHLRIDVPDDQAVAARLTQHGYITEAISPSCHTTHHSGLLLGYARLPETQAPHLAHALHTSLTPPN